jgi:polyphosphate kinase
LRRKSDPALRALIYGQLQQPRNLNRRVEVLFPVRDSKLIRHLRDEVLVTYLADVAKARHMQPDGSYLREQIVRLMGR